MLLVAMWRGHAAPKPEWLKSPRSSDYFIGVDRGLERDRRSFPTRTDGCFRASLANLLLREAARKISCKVHYSNVG
jgi:hypothetical protein